MKKSIYDQLFEIKAIGRKLCTRNEYDATPPHLHAYANDTTNEYYIYDEIEDLEELKLMLLIKNQKDIHVMKTTMIVSVILTIWLLLQVVMI